MFYKTTHLLPDEDDVNVDDELLGLRKKSKSKVTACCPLLPDWSSAAVCPLLLRLSLKPDELPAIGDDQLLPQDRP